MSEIDYAVDPAKRPEFVQAIARYWPGVSAREIEPAYSGIRPKIVPQGAPAQDFVIQDQRVHGIPGLVNLFGIESPGLTSSLAIAAHVARSLA